jgi:Protein of unknown function (DUF4246)
MLFSGGGLPETTRLLLCKGADANARGGWCGNALQAASARGHESVVTKEGHGTSKANWSVLITFSSGICGSHHLAFQNEHICATVLYDYEMSNITESLLSFRQQRTPMECRIDRTVTSGFLKSLDVNRKAQPFNMSGTSFAKEGHLLTFPNIFHHRVGPFGLADKTKPGHRKILALFLVDPHIRIISTANVPCQQKAFWAEELRAQRTFPKFPNEVPKEVVDAVEGFPLDVDEAKALRLELTEEGKIIVHYHEQQFESAIFSLC